MKVPSGIKGGTGWWRRALADGTSHHHANGKDSALPWQSQGGRKSKMWHGPWKKQGGEANLSARRKSAGKILAVPTSHAHFPDGFVMPLEFVLGLYCVTQESHKRQGQFTVTANGNPVGFGHKPGMKSRAKSNRHDPKTPLKCSSHCTVLGAGVAESEEGFGRTQLL